MKKIKTYRTDLLFPKTSFLIGMGLVGNLFGGYYKYNDSKTGIEADRKALLSDLGVVGQNIRQSIQEIFNSIKSN